MPTQDEIMTEIVPSLGVVIGTLMFLSPLKAVLDMRRNGRIGVSTAPFVFQIQTRCLPVLEAFVASGAQSYSFSSRRCQLCSLGGICNSQQGPLRILGQRSWPAAGSLLHS